VEFLDAAAMEGWQSRQSWMIYEELPPMRQEDFA